MIDADAILTLTMDRESVGIRIGAIFEHPAVIAVGPNRVSAVISAGVVTSNVELASQLRKLAAQLEARGG
jgi:hypothetical protein